VLAPYLIRSPGRVSFVIITSLPYAALLNARE
jgi:hypothetical protein